MALYSSIMNEDLDEPEGESEAYRLLTECEDPAVQDKLNDWEREFLESNLRRKLDGAPITSPKVIATLQKIAGYKHGKAPTERLGGSRRYEGFGGRGRR